MNCPKSTPQTGDVAPSGEVIWSRAPHVLWRVVVDQALLLRADGGGVLALNRSGTALWQALDVPGTAGVLAARLCETYGSEPEVLAEDISLTLLDLADRGLVSFDDR